MSNTSWRGASWFNRTILGLTLGLVGLATLSCSAPAPVPSEALPPEQSFRITATIEDIMRSMIDPSADAVWDAVVTVVTDDGVDTTAPETNEDWLELRRHAVTIVEATNLLLMDGRRVAKEGSRSEFPGVDLEPEEISALLAEDRDSWNRLIGELHASGVEVLNAVDALDVDALLVAGDGLDLACENCHARYWYPGFAGRQDVTP